MKWKDSIDQKIIITASTALVFMTISLVLAIFRFSSWGSLIFKPLLVGIGWFGLSYGLLVALSRYLPEVYDILFLDHSLKGMKVNVTVGEDEGESPLSSPSSEEEPEEKSKPPLEEEEAPFESPEEGSSQEAFSADKPGSEEEGSSQEAFSADKPGSEKVVSSNFRLNERPEAIAKAVRTIMKKE